MLYLQSPPVFHSTICESHFSVTTFKIFTCVHERQSNQLHAPKFQRPLVLTYKVAISVGVKYVRNSNMTSFKRFESKPVVKIILIYDRLNL